MGEQMTSTYADKPWLSRYEPGQAESLTPEFENALEMFRASVARDPEGVFLRYFDGVITRAELDSLSDAFAAGLLSHGLERGDRVGIYLQNVPQWVIALIGTWKAGGIAVSINPMNKARELHGLLADSRATVLVCLESLYPLAQEAAEGTAVRTVVTTSELEYQTRSDPRVFDGAERIACDGAVDMARMLEEHRGQQPPPIVLSGDDVAFLVYTSGTTGPPKGAMNTHRNVVFNAQTYREWCHLGPDDVIFGVAPLFHITGLIGHIGVGLLVGCQLVLFCRFEPSVALEQIRDHGCTFTVGSITVFIALMNAPDSDREALATLSKIWSGGAPIPPATVKAFAAHYGQYIHNIYGLTETTSPSHGVPYGADAPVDDASGALSVGVPVYDTMVRIVDDERKELPVGEVGEIVISGPQVVSGYWDKPEESRTAFPEGALHTGDVGYMNEDGWFFIVDRKKDQINAGGYKVWPREVEDVLYEHEAVREAAVIGVADPYRGESVKAFVSLKPGASVDIQELADFCRQRLAAYKYPRQIEVLAELPKTVTGKILRRELRDR
jgi:long-chain acyl-CoA synthetase